jgi:lantibiotic leader peptide-processing serine protease
VRKLAFLVAACIAALGAAVLPGSVAHATEVGIKAYLVVLDDGSPNDHKFSMSDADRQAALSLITSQGGVVLNDLSKDIGVLTAQGPASGFAETLEASPLILDVGQDVGFKAMPSYAEAVAQGLTTFSDPGDPSPEPSSDPLEPTQWDMQMIRTEQAHAIQAGKRAVEVGVLDSGIDATHADFQDPLGGGSNVDCVKARDSVATTSRIGVRPQPPYVELTGGIGTPAACQDNQFHGTHVAGTIAAQANGLGMVGVAPNVTLVPVKVCDTAGYCYASAVIDGIYYSGLQRFEVINMSFFVDDTNFLASTEFKCSSDPIMRTIRHAVERAIDFARMRGVVPVAALGNSSQDLAHPAGFENDCEVIPAETQGVVGTSALNNQSRLSSYSNYGVGMNDVSAPGGAGTTGNCTTAIPSTFPVNTYACISGTSMASPHAAGVAALIVSQYGKPTTYDHDGDSATPPLPDWEMRPQEVENYLQSTTIDIGLKGYDECYGNGRVDALKAVTHDTSVVYEPKDCQHYATQPGQ